MAAQREYELVLMLDPGRDAPGRDAVAQEAKSQIEAGGALKHESNWGLRKLAYEIAQRNEADYRWYRFEAPTGLLEQLNHNLRIAEGVLRFRIFKVDASAPVMAPPATSAPGPGASRERPTATQAEGGAEPAAEPELDAAVPKPDAAVPKPDAAEPEPDEAAAPTAVAEPPAEAAPAAAEPAAGDGEDEPAPPASE